MSFSIFVGPIAKRQIPSALNAAAEAFLATPTTEGSHVMRLEDTPGFPVAPTRDLLGKGIDAAVAMASVAGQPNDLMTVSVVGHANLGHGRRDGWSNETLAVTVGVTDALPPTPEPTPMEVALGFLAEAEAEFAAAKTPTAKKSAEARVKEAKLGIEALKTREAPPADQAPAE